MATKTAVAAASQNKRRTEEKAETKTASTKAKVMTPRRSKATKDPEGGLTQAGREYFKKKQGAHLRPGVKGKADTPDKEKRKGSFLRRHFAKPRGPMVKDGEPTRLALSAHAWGEPVPKTIADARKLAAKGAKLLERYHRDAEASRAKPAPKGSTTRKRVVAKKAGSQ